MRACADGDVIDGEPWRAKAFPGIKDRVVDRSAFDRIIQSGGYITSPTGAAPEAHSTPVPKPDADRAFENATCIGCGACVAACPNGAAMLFTSAKITHLNLLPQGQPERTDRTRNMVAAMDAEDFGGCTNVGEHRQHEPRIPEVGAQGAGRVAVLGLCPGRPFPPVLTGRQGRSSFRGSMFAPPSANLTRSW